MHGGKWKKFDKKLAVVVDVEVVDVTTYEVEKTIWKKELEEMMCTDVVAFADIT